MDFEAPVPVFRIFSVEKAKEFYVGYLGFEVAWEHTFGENLPVYMEVRRGSLKLHLSEHHGDACPGSTILVEMNGIEDLHRELSAKGYQYLRPGIQQLEWGAKGLTVTDPFHNRIRFSEPTI